MSVEEVKVDRYTSFVKDYAHWYAEHNGIDGNGALSKPVFLFCDLLAMAIEASRYAEGTAANADDYGRLVRGATKVFISACIELKSEEVYGGMGWIQEYDGDQGERLLLEGKLLLQAAKDALDYNMNIPAEDEIERKCRLVVRFLARAHPYARPAVESSDPLKDSDMLRCKRAYEALDFDVGKDVIMQKFLKDFQGEFINRHLTEHSFYIRGIALLQSSGYGKSRLLRNTGLFIPSFYIVVEAPSDPKDEKKTSSRIKETQPSIGSPFPLPDRAVCKFLFDQNINRPGHHVAAAFMSALFTQLYIYIAIGYAGTSDLNLLCYAPRSEEICMSVATNLRKAKEIMAGLVVTKSLAHGILDQLYQLRPQCPNGEREGFFANVLDLAAAFLELRTEGLAAGTKFDDKTYLHLLGLEGSIADLFQLIDGTSDGLEAKLPNVKGSSKPHQFIFGLDNCAYVEGLLEEEHYDFEGCPRGLASFARVFRDLETLNAAQNSRHPSRRVWFLIAGTDAKNVISIVPDTKSVEVSEGAGKYHGAYRIVTIWSEFGMDHILRRKLEEDKDFYVNMSIGQMHHCDHLKLLGRALWSVDETAKHAIELGLQKILINRTLPCRDLTRFIDPTKMNTLAFSLASIRFGIGDDMMVNSRTDIFLTMEAVNKHLRTLMLSDGKHAAMSSTPSEPIFALAALLILNYEEHGHQDWWCEEKLKLTWRPSKGFNQDPITSKKWRRSSDGFSWATLLMEMSIALDSTNDLSYTLFRIESNGGLAGRVILTLARDCTLPLLWGTRKKLPCSRFKMYIEELVGKEQAKAILAKADNPALSQALVNFIQFTPSQLEIRSLDDADDGNSKDSKCDNSNSDDSYSDDSHSDDVNKDRGDIVVSEGALQRAFTRCQAFILPPNPKKIHAIIPIAMPKKPQKVRRPDGNVLVDEGSKLTDYEYSYIAIRTQAQGTPYTGPLESYPIACIGGTTRHAAAVILMDMLVGHKKFDTDLVKCPGRVSDHVSAEIVTNNVLEIRIRGLSCAYHRLTEVDYKASFEVGVHKAIAPYNQTVGRYTGLPFSYRGVQSRVNTLDHVGFGYSNVDCGREGTLEDDESSQEKIDTEEKEPEDKKRSD